MDGVTTTNLPMTNLADEVLVNSQGATRLINIVRLVAQVAALQGPAYATRAELFADLSWPANSVGRVYDDSTTSYNGVYKKSGAVGSGDWTWISDLPSGAVENAQIQALTTELRNGRVWYTVLSDLSTQTPPTGTDLIIIARNFDVQIWRRLSADPDPVDPAVHTQTADSTWWRLSEDSAELRTQVAQLDAALADAVTRANATVLTAASPSGEDIDAEKLMVFTSLADGVQIWEPAAAPGDGLETDTLKLDANGRWWSRTLDSRFIEQRGLRLYRDRAEAENLLANTPIPDTIFRVEVIEDDRINIRSRTEADNDPLFPQSPYWGVERAIPLEATARYPRIVGERHVGADLRADYGLATGLEIDWQISDTGETADPWSPVGSDDIYTIAAGDVGKYLRFRVRGPATGGLWAVSNVLGKVISDFRTLGLTAKISAQVSGFGGQRTYTPEFDDSLMELVALRSGVGAGLPLDLYRDNGVIVGDGWIDEVTAPLPTEACVLNTTYPPIEHVIHPCVIEFHNEFCGYRYVCVIMASTGDETEQDPFVYGSNDRINWDFLGAAPQPLSSGPTVAGSYISDPFLLHDPHTGSLVVGYREYLPRDELDDSVANSDVILKCRTTRNGYEWSGERVIMTIPADDSLVQSPSIVYDPKTSTWHMWTMERPVLRHWTAKSLYGPWTLDPVTIGMPGFTTPHRQEVKWVGDRLACLVHDRDRGNLYFGVFADRSWTTVEWGDTGVLDPRPASVFKASFVPTFNAANNSFYLNLWWTSGALGPSGGTDNGLGRKLQYARTNSRAFTLREEEVNPGGLSQEAITILRHHYVSFSEYSPAADDATDDGPKLQQAIDETSSAGEKLRIPPLGTYLIGGDSTGYIRWKSNMDVDAAGARFRRFGATTGNIGWFSQEDPADRIENVKWNGGIFDANFLDGVTSGRPFSLNVARLKLSNLSMLNWGGGLLFGGVGIEHELDNIYAEVAAGQEYIAGNGGIRWLGGSDLAARRCRIFAGDDCFQVVPTHGGPWGGQDCERVLFENNYGESTRLIAVIANTADPDGAGPLEPPQTDVRIRDIVYRHMRGKSRYASITIQNEHSSSPMEKILLDDVIIDASENQWAQCIYLQGNEAYGGKIRGLDMNKVQLLNPAKTPLRQVGDVAFNTEDCDLGKPAQAGDRAIDITPTRASLVRQKFGCNGEHGLVVRGSGDVEIESPQGYDVPDGKSAILLGATSTTGGISVTGRGKFTREAGATDSRGITLGAFAANCHVSDEMSYETDTDIVIDSAAQNAGNRVDRLLNRTHIQPAALDMDLYALSTFQKITGGGTISSLTPPVGGAPGSYRWLLATTFSRSMSTQDTVPTGIAWSSDGAKLYEVGDGANLIYEYDVATPWDISTATFSQSIATQDASPSGIAWSSDGTRLYEVGFASDLIYEYAVATPWDISTATFLQSMATQDTSPTDIAWSADGAKLYETGASSDLIYEYDVATPWDISTATFTQSIAAQDSNSRGIAWSPDGTRLYEVGLTSGRIYQWDVATPWDLSTASFLQSMPAQDGNSRGIAWSPDGTRLYEIGATSDLVYQYDLSTPWDISAFVNTTIMNLGGNIFTGTGADVIVAAGQIKTVIWNNADQHWHLV